ncbi:uncharacterized protein TTMY_1277 [Thermus thermophilus]|nr:uncharacterized protein TTMY_1277 [Thermus thermophilus]
MCCEVFAASPPSFSHGWGTMGRNAGKPLWVEAYALEPVGERGERLALDLVLRVLAP